MKSIKFIIVVLISAAIYLSSCAKEKLELAKANPADTIVSFSKDIFTNILNRSCGCHGSSNTYDFSSAGVAYTTISNSLINKTNPGSSLILHPENEHSNNMTPADTVITIRWIRQGAKNN